MTWNLIALPAPEELTMGYSPAPGAESGELRRFLVTLFAAIGLTVGLHSALADEPPAGQRRIAEVELAERKAECRACAPSLARAAGDRAAP